MIVTLQELVKKFQSLSEITGTDKMSSYQVKVTYTLYDGIWLDLGCYNIGDWPRHVGLGPFDSEEKLCKAFELKIEEAKKEIEEAKTGD